MKHFLHAEETTSFCVQSILFLGSCYGQKAVCVQLKPMLQLDSVRKAEQVTADQEAADWNNRHVGF